MIDDAGNDEQKIGQPIDVGEQVRLDVIRAERDNRSLGAPAHGPRKMQQRTGSIAARQNETAQRRQLGLESIDPVFEPSNVGVRHRDFRDTVRDLFGWVRKPCADSEQILLQLLDESGNISAEVALGLDSAKAGIQLIDIAVGGHARVGLRHAGPAEQPSAAGVAGTRVDFHGRQYT